MSDFSKKLTISTFPNTSPTSPPNVYSPGQTLRGVLFLNLKKDTKAKLIVISFKGLFAENPTRTPFPLFPQRLDLQPLISSSQPQTITSITALHPHAPATYTYKLFDYELVAWGTEKPLTTSTSNQDSPTNNSFPNRHSRSSSTASSLSWSKLQESKTRALTKAKALVALSSSLSSSKSSSGDSAVSTSPSTTIPSFKASHGRSASGPPRSQSSPSDYQSGILTKGVHRFEFEFEIPHNLPSSYQADNPRTRQEIRIQYELSARLHKAAFPMDRRVSVSQLHLVRIEDNRADPFSAAAMRFSEGRSETRREKEMVGRSDFYNAPDVCKSRQKGKGKEKPEICVRAVAERSIAFPGQNLPIRVRIDGLPEYEALLSVQVKLRKLVRYGPPGQSSLYTEDISFAPPPTLSRASPNRRAVELVTNLKVPGIYSRRRRRQHPKELAIQTTALPTPSGLPSSYDSGYFTQISSSPSSTTFIPSSDYGASKFLDKNDILYSRTVRDANESAEARGYKVAYPPSVSHGVCPYFSVVYVVRVKIVVACPEDATARPTSRLSAVAAAVAGSPRIPPAKDDGNENETAPSSPSTFATPPSSVSTSPTLFSSFELSSPASSTSSSCNRVSATGSVPSCGGGEKRAECENHTDRSVDNETPTTATATTITTTASSMQNEKPDNDVVSCGSYPSTTDARNLDRTPTSDSTKTTHQRQHRRWRLSSASLNGWKDAFRFGSFSSDRPYASSPSSTLTPSSNSSSSQTIELDVGITVAAPRRRIRRRRSQCCDDVAAGGIRNDLYGRADDESDEDEAEEEEEEETDVAVAGPSNPPMLPLSPAW